jgi:hypothetical protein
METDQPNKSYGDPSGADTTAWGCQVVPIRSKTHAAPFRSDV